MGSTWTCIKIADSALAGSLILTAGAWVEDIALAAISHRVTEDIDSPIVASINRGRAMGKNNPLPPLPAFIRITDRPKPIASAKGGTHASPQGHERRGHWRTYKSDGRRVWVNETKVRGGSPVPRDYRVDTARKFGI
jgi:hypothetical protein